MQLADASPLLGPSLSEALSKKGYTNLTPVQEAVLDPALADRDLRISSQTGSGKTLAIGFALRKIATEKAEALRGVARPNALVVTPTRELAKQVEAELGWLFASSRVRVTSVTGGASYRDEQRAFAAGPGVLVGTPGRLLDHLRRGSIDPANLSAVVLDEADRMLDLGFREDLEAILSLAPEGHRTHLVSATFAREVQALANRVQHQPAHVEGTPLGSANTDIEHVVHLVAARERMNALVNLLLADPDAQTLIFARTRADVAQVAEELHKSGFAVDSLSGEMEQPARNRAIAAFKRGDLHALVATDVAARGIDHRDIARVIQMEPPTDADTYTHRSGRTGRAGRKGVSAVLVAPSGLSKLSALLKRAGVRFRTEPIPTAQSIAKAQDERLFAELTRELSAETEPEAGQAAEVIDARTAELARRIAESSDPARALARLLARTRRSGLGAPREVTPVTLGASPKSKARTYQDRESSDPRGRRNGGAHPGNAQPGGAATGVPFRVSWGQAHGADPRRLLAMLCRRGNIRGSDIGSIYVAPTFSVVQVAPAVADDFERATRDPDPRDPRVSVRREQSGGPAEQAPRQASPARGGSKPPRAQKEPRFQKAPRTQEAPRNRKVVHENKRPETPARRS